MPANLSGFTFGGKPYNAIGANDSNNIFDSSSVVANADGSVLERQEYIQSLLLGNEPVSFTINALPSVDEDGGRFIATVSIVDRNTGKIASGSIDITGATYALKKSTADGAFSTAGVTQPAGATKATGRVDLEFAIVAAEWASGDSGQLELDGITATVGGATYYAGVLQWPFTILETLDVKTAVDAIKVDVDVPGAADNATAAASATIHEGQGRKDDTALASPLTAAVTSTASLFRYVKTLMARTIAPSAADNATAAASASLYETVGRKDDASVYAKSATASQVAYLKALLDAGIVVKSTTTSAGTTTQLNDTARTEANNYYAGATVIFLTGVNQFQARLITASSSGNLQFATSLGSAAGNGDSYIIVPTALTGLLVASTDTTNNNTMAQVVGNKSDGANAGSVGTTQSLVAYAKQLVNQTIVPTADVTTNAAVRDVVGNKTDASVETVGTTKSIVAYLKGLLGLMARPSAADNATAAASASLYETVGRKDDALSTNSAGTTVSVMALLKGTLARVNAATADNTGTGGVNDSVGNKADSATAGSTVNSTTSLMGYVKGLFANLNGITSADSTNNNSMRDVAGNKTDAVITSVGTTNSLMAVAKTILQNVGFLSNAAATTINSGSSLMAYVKAIMTALGFWTQDAYATVSCGASAETAVVAQVTVTKPTHVIAKIDLTNLTVNATVKVYHAMGVSPGATLTAEASRSFTVATDAKVIPIDFWTDGDYKITVTTGAEGSNRNVYVRHSRQATQ